MIALKKISLTRPLKSLSGLILKMEIPRTKMMRTLRAYFSSNRMFCAMYKKKL